MTNDTIGVDISKDHLEAHRMSDGASRRFANDQAGHRSLMSWLGRPGTIHGRRIVYEPTGPYHRALERSLAAAGLALVKVNPRQARRFAEATGRLAKTDRLDAAMLARMGALLELEARPARSPLLSDLKDLHMAREALVKNRTAAKNRAKTLTLAAGEAGAPMRFIATLTSGQSVVVSVPQALHRTARQLEIKRDGDIVTVSEFPLGELQLTR